MSSLFARRDVIVVASVSCIYGIGSKEDYEAMVIPLRVGMAFTREQLLSRLVDIQYTRNDIAFERAQFRVRGDTLELRPGYTEDALRIEFFGDEIDRITRFEPLTGEVLEQLQAVVIYPGKQFVTTNEKLKAALLTIREELGDRIAWFEKHGKLLEAQRIKMRTEYDLEMMEEMGVCSGIENYSRHIAARPPGSRPTTLIDFMPDDFLLVMDESHVSVPQIGGMYAGDRSRKEVLVEHGFRLPSALDNRPLDWLEFQSLQKQTIYVSATPAPREMEWAKASAAAVGRASSLPQRASSPRSFPASSVSSAAEPRGQDARDGRLEACPTRDGVVELVVRPTGLIDPTITLKPLKGQIDDLIEECRKRVEKKERVLVTTLTKRTAEELTDYLRDIGINVRYLHSEVDALERVEIIRGLRKGQFDVLVGINLLREGLDLPEVSLVAILDADKEGFLRSETSLIQTAGRAARHLNGEVILYADVKTKSIQRFLAVCEYRRKKQVAYNTAHGITPRSVTRVMEESLSSQKELRDVATGMLHEAAGDFDVTETIRELEGQMIEASNKLEFEKAALFRDQINELKRMVSGEAPTRQMSYGKKPAKSRKTGKPTWTPRI